MSQRTSDRVPCGTSAIATFSEDADVGGERAVIRRCARTSQFFIYIFFILYFLKLYIYGSLNFISLAPLVLTSLFFYFHFF